MKNLDITKLTAIMRFAISFIVVIFTLIWFAALFWKAVPVPNTFGADEACYGLPGRVDFTVVYRTYESYEKRIEWETNPFVTTIQDQRTVTFLPSLTEGWVPTKTDPSEIEEEKMIVMGYIALESLDEFSGWETYQPEL